MCSYLILSPNIISCIYFVLYIIVLVWKVYQDDFILVFIERILCMNEYIEDIITHKYQ